MNKTVLAAGLVVSTPLLGILVANLGRDPHAIDSPLVLKPAPSVRFRAIDGGDTLVLDSLKGKPVVINFWASWCVPCVEEHQALLRAAKSNSDVAFLGVVYEDNPKDAEEFLKARGAAYPAYLDEEGKAAIAFGIYGVPETFFIDAKGMIVSKKVGPLDDADLARRLLEARR